jgi:hypothetical protein
VGIAHREARRFDISLTALRRDRRRSFWRLQ